MTKTGIKIIIKTMNKYFNSVRKSIWVVPAICACVSCNQAWNDHYSTDYSIVPSSTIMEGIEGMDGTDKFIQALKTTNLLRGSEKLPATFYDFLNSDQYLTVWVPEESSISDAEWAVYTKPNKSKDENKLVAQEFLMNHIARYSHPTTKVGGDKILMLSSKRYISNKNEIDGISYKSGATDKIFKNGLVHRVNGNIDYKKNIYEYITSAEEYKSVIGDFFLKYTREEVDKDKSVQSGINDEGEMEYIDSVIVLKSILLSKYGLINEEDSNYLMVLPTPAAWKAKHDEVIGMYDFGKVVGADSLAEFYTQSALMTDMFFNMNIQTAKKDSVNSTTFKKSERNTEPQLKYHTFFKPYEADGLFKKDSIGQYLASNGKIIFTSTWPYVDTLTYATQIKVEAEDADYIDEAENSVSSKKILRNNQEASNKFTGRISGEAVRVLGGKDGYEGWEIQLQVKNNLKGKYRVKLVVIPDMEIQKPNAINPIIYYKSTKIYEPKNKRGRAEVFYPCGIPHNNYDGDAKTLDFVNKVDTITLPALVEIPYCDYDSKTSPANVRVQLKSSMKPTEANEKFSTNLYLDCVIFEPVLE